MEYKIIYEINYSVESKRCETIDEICNTLKELRDNQTFKLITICDCW